MVRMGMETKLGSLLVSSELHTFKRAPAATKEQCVIDEKREKSKLACDCEQSVLGDVHVHVGSYVPKLLAVVRILQPFGPFCAFFLLVLLTLAVYGQNPPSTSLNDL